MAIDDEDIDPLEGWESPTTPWQPEEPATSDQPQIDPAADVATDPTIIRRPPISLEPGGYDMSVPRDQAPWEPDRAYEPWDQAPYEPARATKPALARKRARHGCLSFVLWLVMLMVLFFMAVRCVPSAYANGRAIPELASFVPLMLVPLLIVVVLSLLWHRRVLTVVSIAALVAMGWWHAGYFNFLDPARVSREAAAAVAQTATTADTAARVMTLNTSNGKASAAEIVEVVREQNVEILCLQELTDNFVSELYAAGIGELLPYHVISDGASEVNNGGRNGIWTLAPMENVSTNLLSIETSSMPAASLWIGDTLVRVVSVHPNSPIRGAQDLWERGLSVIGSLAGYDHAYLIMGDFNSTWDHARFRELLGTTFADAGESSGEGFHMTYPSGRLPALIEIDHIVYSRDSGIVVSDLETIAIAGTDHRALLGTLEAS